MIGLSRQCRKGLQCGFQPFQAAAYGFGGAAEADAKVLRMFEELSWHHAGFKFVLEHGDKVASAAGFEARKNGGAEAAGLAFEFGMLGQKLVYECAIRL